LSFESGARRSSGNLLIVAGIAALLAAAAMLAGFHSELPALAGIVAAGESAVASVTASETGALVFLGVLLLAGALLAALPGPGRRLLAVARTSFTEARRGGALWLAVIAAAAVAAGAPMLDYQGGPAERLKIILSAGLGAATLVGMLLAVVLPALSFSRETETRSIFVIATKPVPRWAVFGGKLLGVGLALAAAMALMGAGISTAARLAMAAEARRAADPEIVGLSLTFRRDVFPDQADRAAAGPDGRLRPVRLVRGQSRTTVLRVPREELGGRWLVLRLQAQPADPLMTAARARLTCGEWSQTATVLRDRPASVPIPVSAVRDGLLAVSVAPEPDTAGNVHPLLTHPRGAVALAVAGDGLETAVAKALACLWLQLMVVAAVTLAAAGSLSFPVAAVAGAATAVFGLLSGLAVGLLRQAVEAGARDASGGAVAQLMRKLAAGALSLLPDFERCSAADSLAGGDFVPWGLLAAGVLSLLVARALPAALVGALAFTRREVGR